MREAEIAALPLSSPPKRADGEDEGEEGEDERSLPAAAAGGASPAIRPPSPGMGEVEASCREGAGGGLLEGSGVDEELEFPPGFEKVSEIMEVNGGSGNWVLEVEATEAVQRRESGVSVDIRNSSELSPLGREEVKDGCRAAEVGKERVVASVDIGNCSEREYVGGCMSVGNGDCEELEVPPGFEKVGEAMEVNGCSGDRVLEVVVAEAVHIGDSGVSVDIRSSSELSSLGREKVEDGYGEVAEVGKECVPPATENGDCSEASISERKEIKEESQLHVDEDALGDNNAASVGIRNGSEVSVPGKKDNGEECWGVLRVEEENGLAESEAQNMVVEEEHDDFPGLSPLRISGRDGLGNSSGIDIGLEVGHIVEMFDNGRVCDEDAFLGTSELAAGCSSVEINGDSDKQTGEFCAPSHLSEECLSVSQGSNANWLAEKCENLLQLEPEKLNSGECNDNMNCSNECSREKNAVAVEYQGAKIEQAEADISGPLEVISTHLKEVVEGDRCQTSLLENEVYYLMQDLPDKLSTASSEEGLASLQASHLSTSMKNYSSKLFLTSNSKVGSADDVNGTSTCCSNVNSSSGEADNGGSTDTKSSSIIVFRRSNPKRAASLKCSPSTRKSNQLTRTTSSSRKCRKSVGTNTSFSCAMHKMSGIITRKRSCSRRPMRLSVWGAVENLTKIITPSSQLLGYDLDTIPTQNKRSKKGRSDCGRKKRPLSQNGRRLKVLAADFATSSSPPMFNAAASKRTSDEDGNNFKPSCDYRVDIGILRKVEVISRLAGDRCGVRVKLSQQHGDKDLESTLTQDTSADSMLGECPGVSSQIVPKTLVGTVDDMQLPLDPGTSPDSDVCHPTLDIGKMTSEGTTSRNQVVGNGQVVPVASNRRASASLTYSNAFVMSLPALVPESHTYHRKGSRNGEANEQPSSIPKHVSEKLGMARARQSSRYSKSKQKKQVVSNDTQIVCLKSIGKTTRKGSKWKSFPGESSVLGIAELDCCEESLKVQNGFETCVLPGQDVSNLQLEETVRTDKTEGSKLSRSTKPRPTKGRCSCSESSRRRRQNVRGKKKANIRISDCECRIEEQSQLLDSSLEATHVTSFSSEVDNKLALIKPSEGNGKCSVGSRVDPEDVSSTVMTALGDELPPKVSSHGLEGQPLPPRVAWVLCDDCQKWRCISSALADILGATNCRWTCKDNSDKAFADCSIPQEKTNAEINAELEISDEEDVSTKKPIPMGNGPSKLSAFQRASWIPIKSNLFMHRNRRTQNIDEIMVCHCKRLLNGRLGCGDECLNRMLNIECVKGTCPCGDLCSNQQFQKRKYAKFKWFRCGKKGFGLQLQEDVSQGQFLIEYVGEVLDIAAYEARQRYYASRGQKHFYFMTLNGGEVIDACAKGNLGRFINHSCDPNCRTEKWMVNGEVCIGLFAMRDIKKGEEVTFDYNYERVFGAAAKKCVCGSSECRGYIGGDPLNSDVIIQGDSDEEDLEPVMVRGDTEKEWDVDWPLTDATTVTCQDVSVQREAILIKSSPIREPDVSTQIKDTMERSLSDANMIDIPPKHLDRVQSEENMCISEVQLFEDSKQISNSIQTGETICKPFCEIQAIETSAQNLITTKELLSESIANNNKVLSEPVDENPITSKPHPLAKSSRSSNTIKKGRSGLKQLVPPKTKKLPASTGTGHSERVEEKLNELIDENGGISKRKDATKGYLKLLFVTAAGGDNDRGCAAQSARDLSLILDAILKTKSRMVLVDIINKNGLQMLHNIMKQNRSNFNRTPIIRKLLKVLEFLAQKGILTPEHIDKSPPFDKMESFKQSITALTWHSDTQVHQIARNFRDKWIPRTISRVEPSDRDSGKLDLQRSYGSWSKPSNFKCRHDQETRETDAIVCVSLEADPPASSSEGNISGEASLLNQQPSISAPSNDGSFVSGTRIRKRKSRWDESSDIGSPNPHSLWSSENHSVQGGPKFLKPTPLQPELASQSEVSMKQPEAQRERNSSYGEAVAAKSSMLQNSDEETPPGFGSPQKDNGPQISSQISMATGEVVMGQLQERYLSCLPVSYGIPAALMQQLGTPDAVGGNHGNLHWAIAPGMPFHPFPPLPPYPRPSSRAQTSCNDPMTAHGAREERATDHTIPSTSGEEAGDMDETGARNLKINGKGRWLANNPVRNSQRDQRAPPWPQRWNSQRNQRWSSWPRRGSGWPSWPRKGSGWPSWPRKGSEWPPWSQKGSDCGFRGSLRNRSPGLGLRGVRRDNRGGFNFPESVSNRDVTSNCHQQPNIS